MRIVIIGGGKVGGTIAEQLTKEGHDITVVDSEKRITDAISDSLDLMAICGNGCSVEVLQQANVDESDLVIACTAQDELNIMCCMFARKLGCKNTIARVRSPEYSSQIYMIREDLGLNMIVNPELNTAQEIFRLLELPSVLKRDTFSGGRIEIVELEAHEGDRLDGMRLTEVPRRLGERALLCAVQRGDAVFIPDGRFVVNAGDKLYLCAPATDIVRILHNLGTYKKRVKNVMIIGGSRVAAYLARMLLRTGAHVCILENDAARARELAESLSEASVICADGTSTDVLHSENVEHMDSVVTLTNIDEENIVLSMYIHSLGVTQIVTKVDHTEYGNIFRGSGVERLVSPKRLCANTIIRYVRNMQNTGGSSVQALHHLVDGRVDALEFAVTGKTRYLGVKLRDLRLKPNILIACINQRGHVLVPGGDDYLSEGDTVVIVTHADRIILDLNDIFADEG